MGDIMREDKSDRLEPSWSIEAWCTGCNARTRRRYSSLDAERIDMQTWAALHEDCP